MKYAALALLLASPVAAQDYALHATDTQPDAATLTARILDRDLEYFDGGISRYNADGSYAWTYAPNNGGGIWEGTHEITDNLACVTFVTGVARCDLFVLAGDRLVLLTADGQRFPLREIR